jgi:hypothetical protein
VNVDSGAYKRHSLTDVFGLVGPAAVATGVATCPSRPTYPEPPNAPPVVPPTPEDNMRTYHSIAIHLREQVLPVLSISVSRCSQSQVLGIESQFWAW